MRLTNEQLSAFDEHGYLFLEACFGEEEVALLRAEAESIYLEDRKEVWREKSGTPRTAFAAHTYNEAFRRLGAHPRLIEPVEQLLGERLYMHQFKINAKAPFDGELWQWHQDYGVWAREDGMPEPRAMNISVFLEEVMPFNGPLMLIPKSHKEGVLVADHDTTTTSYPIWSVDRDTVTRLAAQGGIVAPTGKAGSVLMFHCNLVHASPPNITLPTPGRSSISRCARYRTASHGSAAPSGSPIGISPRSCLPRTMRSSHWPVPDAPPSPTEPAESLRRRSPPARRRARGSSQARRSGPQSGATACPSSWGTQGLAFHDRPAGSAQACCHTRGRRRRLLAAHGDR
jgi:ectoine hydroxylase